MRLARRDHPIHMLTKFFARTQGVTMDVRVICRISEYGMKNMAHPTHHDHRVAGRGNAKVGNDCSDRYDACQSIDHVDLSAGASGCDQLSCVLLYQTTNAFEIIATNTFLQSSRLCVVSR